MKSLIALFVYLSLLGLNPSQSFAGERKPGISPWGEDDEIGRLNLMSAASQAEVLSRVRGNKSYDLSVEYFIGMPSWQAAGDPHYRIWMTHSPRGTVIDDPLHLGKEMNEHVSYTGAAISMPERAYPEQWDTDQLEASLKQFLNLEVPAKAWAAEDGIDVETVRERIVKRADEAAAAKVAKYSPQIMRSVEKQVLLQSIDGLWREHLVTLDHLSKVIGWRGLAQRDPLNEYKQEAYELFQKLLTDLRELVTSQLSHVEIQVRQPDPPPELDLSRLSEIHIDPTSGENDAGTGYSGTLGGAMAAAGALADGDGDVMDADPRLRPIDPALLRNVSRNSPCPCGSGKKFKHCHGSF